MSILVNNIVNLNVLCKYFSIIDLSFLLITIFCTLSEKNKLEIQK